MSVFSEIKTEIKQARKQEMAEAQIEHPETNFDTSVKRAEYHYRVAQTLGGGALAEFGIGIYSLAEGKQATAAAAFVVGAVCLRASALRFRKSEEHYGQTKPGSGLSPSEDIPVPSAAMAIQTTGL